MSKNEEYTPMTPAQRAALADARETQAQNRRRAVQGNTQATAPRAAAPQRPAQTVPQQRPAQTQRQTSNASAAQTAEYPRQPRTAQGNAPQKNVQKRPATPQNAPKKEDTNEFPTYVRAGKGGYRPPKVKTRRVSRQRRRKLDPRFKAVLLAVGALVLLFIILLACGVRYTKTPLAGDAEIRFFGIVKDGVAQNGWLSYSEGTRGSLKDGNTIEYADGSVYTGSLIDCKRSGQGTFTYANGDVYAGSFLEDEMNGQGTLTYANGDKYEGTFQNGMRSGQGTLTYADGSTYVGAFAEDRKNGEGTYTSGNTLFVGNYVNDIKEGYGEQTFSNGDTYKGEYKNDMRNGEGTYTFANGEVYTGNFKDNQMYGQGTFTWPSGRTTSGWFENGVIVN